MYSELLLYLWQPLGVPGVPRDDLLKPLETVVDGRLIQCCGRQRGTEKGGISTKKDEENVLLFALQLQEVSHIILTQVGVWKTVHLQW